VPTATDRCTAAVGCSAPMQQQNEDPKPATDRRSDGWMNRRTCVRARRSKSPQPAAHSLPCSHSLCTVRHQMEQHSRQNKKKARNQRNIIPIETPFVVSNPTHPPSLSPSRTHARTHARITEGLFTHSLSPFLRVSCCHCHLQRYETNRCR
jgi:hypothetical protein